MENKTNGFDSKIHKLIQDLYEYYNGSYDMVQEVVENARFFNEEELGIDVEVIHNIYRENGILLPDNVRQYLEEMSLSVEDVVYIEENNLTPEKFAEERKKEKEEYDKNEEEFLVEDPEEEAQRDADAEQALMEYEEAQKLFNSPWFKIKQFLNKLGKAGKEGIEKIAAIFKKEEKVVEQIPEGKEQKPGNEWKESIIDPKAAKAVAEVAKAYQNGTLTQEADNTLETNGQEPEQ